MYVICSHQTIGLKNSRIDPRADIRTLKIRILRAVESYTVRFED